MASGDVDRDNRGSVDGGGGGGGGSDCGGETGASERRRWVLWPLWVGLTALAVLTVLTRSSSGHGGGGGGGGGGDLLRRALSPLAPPPPLLPLTPVTTATTTATADQCPFGDIDLFVVAIDADYPILRLLLHSVSIFMPCYGAFHLFLDRSSYRKVAPWILYSPSAAIVLHEFAVPDQFLQFTGYTMQQWMMMYADRYVRPEAEFVMFMDTDAIMALPVTCASLFDEAGRVYQMGWDIQVQDMFIDSCRTVLGGGICDRSYMSTFPFLMPKQALRPLRDHIAAHLNVSDFDQAFLRLETMIDIPFFSQFVQMGEYLRIYRPDLVHQVFCPVSQGHDLATFDAFLASTEDMRACMDFVPNGLHYGWRTAGFTLVQKPMANMVDPRDQRYFRSQQPGELSYLSDKHSLRSFQLIEEVVLFGKCLQHYLATDRTELLPDCSLEMVQSIHPELNMYGNDRFPDMEQVYRRFRPELPGPLCSARRQTASSPPPPSSYA